ncbi:MAG TPA: hypothetical protein VFW62_03330, partial [bacterium]|nr:hypothetical protein [bacterium]
LVIEKAGASVYGEEIRGGDNFETAVPLAPNKLFRLNHHQRVNQYDYFSVEAKPGQKIIVSLETGEKGVDIKPDNSYTENLNPYAAISLQAPNRSQLKVENIIGGKNDSRRIIFPVPLDGAGKYYILVGSAYDNQHKDHRFKVELGELFDAGSQQDAGDTRDSALSIQPGTIKGYVNPNDEVDTYKVNLPAGALNLRVRPVSEKVHMNLTLFDAEGVEVARGNAPNPGAVAKIENAAIAKAGEYVLKVSGGYDPPESEYTLEILPAGAVPATDAGAPPASPTAVAPPPVPPAPATPAAPSAPTISADQPLSKPVPMPGVPVASAPRNSKELCPLIKQLPWMQKLKFYGLYSGLPLLGGWLIGMLLGYFKGRGSGKRWAARQALKQTTNPPPK